MVKFPCLVCEKTVGTNHNAFCCYICVTDGYTFIAITFAKKTYRDLKIDQTPWFCKSCI